MNNSELKHFSWFALLGKGYTYETWDPINKPEQVLYLIEVLELSFSWWFGEVATLTVRFMPWPKTTVIREYHHEIDYESEISPLTAGVLGLAAEIGRDILANS